MKVIIYLGLDVSNLNIHKSKDLFEFAKRLYFQGQDITPFPVSVFPISVLKACGNP